MPYQSSAVPCHEESSTVMSARLWLSTLLLLPPAGGSSFASMSTWPHSDQPNSLHRASLSVCFFFFPPRAQMARFRVSCFRQSGATALVKEPEAELIIVIAASYVRNASQAEGAQGQLSHCCCFPGDPWAGAWKWHVSPSEWTASDARREEALLLKMSTSQASRDSTKWRLPGPSESTRPWSYALPWYLATLVWWVSYNNKQ